MKGKLSKNLTPYVVGVALILGIVLIIKTKK
jgi:hypothetical protein